MGRKKHSKKPHEPAGSSSTVDGSTPESNSDVFTCENSPVFGRFLKSKQEIKSGTLILSEKFLLAGPMRSSGLICLGCHAELEHSKSRLKCPNCSWPLCKEKCAHSIFHRDECRFFKEHEIKPPDFLNPDVECTFDFGAITVLRGLLLKLYNEEKWKRLQVLEHHNGVRRLLPLWKENYENVVKPMGELGIGNFFTDEEIHSVCGVLEVNAFELGEEFSYRGIFSTAAMMAHDCIPNATHFEDSIQGIIEVRAAVDIPPGSPITVCYAYALEGTAQRRKMLLETKFFECICDRCSDPVELKTNLSTLICSQCRTGNVVNVKAQEKQKAWRCSSCNARMEMAEIDQLLDKYAVKAEGVHGVKASENFLLECSKHFHSTHFIPFGVKFNLCQAYGRERIGLQGLSQAELERKLALCLEVIQILDIITPGMTITRGLVLYELQAAEITLARRIFETRKFSKALLKRKLEKTLKTLTDSIDILSLSHASTNEHVMAQSAKGETLPDLKTWINALRTK